jgi:hypothetical protein
MAADGFRVTLGDAAQYLFAAFSCEFQGVAAIAVNFATTFQFHTSDSLRLPMASRMLRACVRMVVALVVASQSRADEAESLKQLNKVGGRFVSVGSENMVILEGKKATDQALKLLSELKSLNSLRLNDTNITDEGFKEVGRLKNLKLLLVMSTNITDAAVKELRGLENLEQLTLDRTSVTGEGLTELKNLKKLKSLNFCGPNVTDASLGYVAELSRVRFLVLSNSRVTDAGIRELRR